MSETDYTILRGTNTTSLEKLVNEHLRAGYVLAGGISVCSFDECLFFFQAMVKPTPKAQ